jgi:glycosyltransferase involved in cell wall biosynthesis
MAATEGRFYRRFDGHVIAISEKIARELREFYRLRGPISVIPHGVDASRFDGPQRRQNRSMVRAELGLNEAQAVALYVGDLTKAHVHLKALARSAAQVQFIIVSGSTRYLWPMPNVRFLPPTTAIERYYAAADAFVFPTTYDAFGMVVLEAMASGLPVFSSDCAGAAELIQSGRDGVVAPLAEWVEVTLAGLNDRERLQRIGHMAKQSASLFDWVTVVRRVEQVYREVLSVAPSPRSIAYQDEQLGE